MCGTLIVSTSPKWLKYIDQIGMDFVFIDTEHVMIDMATLSWMCTAYAAAGLAPIVRIPGPDPIMATKVLDGGAHGIIVPYIESPAVLRKMVGAVHYKPVKGRKLQGQLENSAPFPSSLNDQLAKANANHMLFANIESVDAMNHLDEILDVQGLDGIVIGPNDLSYSMNMPNDYNNPEFRKSVDFILKKARAKGVAAGIHALGPIENQIAWAKETGINLLFHSGDLYVFVSNMKKDIAAFREALTGKADETEEVSIEI